MRGDDVSGIAVHLAARVMAEALPGEILVSRTVRDLVIGSETVFPIGGHTDSKVLKAIGSSTQSPDLALPANRPVGSTRHASSASNQG